MEQDRKLKEKMNTSSSGQLIYEKGGKTVHVGKTASSPNGAGNSGQLHFENEIRSFFNTIHKNKLKVDYRPKCEAEHYKTPRGEGREVSRWWWLGG